MLEAKDVESYNEWLFQFRAKVVRAVSIRIRLTKNTSKAISFLKISLNHQYGINLLKRAIKNEKWFLRLIEDGLKTQEKILFEIYSWQEENVKSYDVLRYTENFFELIDIFNRSKREVKKRLQLEEEFLEKLDPKSLEKIYKHLKKEVKINNQIIVKLTNIQHPNNFIIKSIYVFVELSRLMALHGGRSYIRGDLIGDMQQLIYENFGIVISLNPNYRIAYQIPDGYREMFLIMGGIFVFLSTASKILEILKDSDDYVQGEFLKDFELLKTEVFRERYRIFRRNK